MGKLLSLFGDLVFYDIVAMIVTATCGFFSVVYVCGIVAVVALPVAIGSSLAVYLTTSVSAGNIGMGDISSAVSATAALAFYFMLMFYSVFWRNIESYFSTTPWTFPSIIKTEKVGKRVYQTRCPFTGTSFDQQSNIA